MSGPQDGMSAMDSWKENETIRVGVRLRPLSQRELVTPTRSKGGPAAHFRHKKGSPSDAYAWITSGQDTILQKGVRKVPGKSVFTFDSVFPESSTTRQVYESLVRPILAGVPAGRNGTVFCYGQSGGGKTFSMQGAKTASAGDNKDGIIQMVADDLFCDIQKHSTDRDFSVAVSYVEIKNEKVRDLLLQSSSSSDDETRHSKASTSNSALRSSSGDLKTLAVREDPKRGGAYVDSNEWQVENASGILDALNEGTKNRACSNTSINDQSSRSHAIFRIRVKSQDIGDKEGRVFRVCNLTLVDLAGSENGHQLSSHRQKEGGRINQSLLSLSQVIHALSAPPNRRPTYINYRDSKLTRLLQPSLSGNASIAVLCCVTPSRLYVEETRSTLKFATRAKLVTTKATMNEITDDTAIIRKLESDLDQARRDIERLEKREQATEQETLEAVKEFQKLKSMIFGGGELPQFQTAFPQQAGPMVPIKKKKPTDEVILTSDTSDTTVTPHWDESPAEPHKGDYHVLPAAPVSPSPPRLSQISAHVKPSPTTRSSRCHEGPPTEVIILREPIPSPLKVEKNQSVVPRSERVEFLGAKLDATEDLVESLFKDVESARACIHTLVFKNVALSRKVARLTRKLREHTLDQDELRLHQYRLLKYSIYVGLLFFFCGNQELYFATVMFLWLCLEVVT